MSVIKIRSFVNLSVVVLATVLEVIMMIMIIIIIKIMIIAPCYEYVSRKIE